MKQRIMSQQDGEADILISECESQLLCYCQPFKGLSENFKLITFGATSIFRSEKYKFKSTKMKARYAHTLTVKVVDCLVPLVKFGEILILLDEYLPKDIEVGEFIDLNVQRLNYVTL